MDRLRSKNYGRDVLAGFSRRPAPAPRPRVAAEPGLVVEERSTGFAGAVVSVEAGAVRLRAADGRLRAFPLDSGDFAVDGAPVLLVRPAPKQPVRPQRTASGSVAVHQARARTARASRLLVEGRHDAELVEKVWGDDLRVEGVVVEMLQGVDALPAVVADFRPTPARRLGVLVDHLVARSKESRIAQQVMAHASAGSVLIVGHPFVDIWQAVRPRLVGLEAWPVVPRTIEWKAGICAAVGPRLGANEPAEFWRLLLGRVQGWLDLEPALLGPVEQLIDFVTEPAGCGAG